MATDLQTFRDHARKMATADHVPTCLAEDGWGRRSIHPAPGCQGCVSDADRALWGRLADEVDTYLTEPEEATLL